MLIQVILTVPLLLLGFFLLTRLRQQIFYRILFIGIAAIGVFFVLNPGITTSLAHGLGVGRGTDLILYLSALFFFMFSMLIYAKLRKTEAVQTDLARYLSIISAQKFPSKE